MSRPPRGVRVSRRVITAVLVAAAVGVVVAGLVVVRVRLLNPNRAQATYQRVDPARLHAMLDRAPDPKEFQLVNVHVPYAGEIERTDAFVPYTEVAARAPRLWPDRRAKLVVYCQTGRMSAIAAEALVRLGYRDVLDLEGGMVAWERAGFSLARR